MSRKTRAPEAWRNAIVRYADEAPESLLANPQNWRIHPREQSKGRAESRLTIRALEWMRVPHHVVIEPQEYEIPQGVNEYGMRLVQRGGVPELTR